MQHNLQIFPKAMNSYEVHVHIALAWQFKLSHLPSIIRKEIELNSKAWFMYNFYVLVNKNSVLLWINLTPHNQEKLILASWLDHDGTTKNTTAPNIAYECRTNYNWLCIFVQGIFTIKLLVWLHFSLEAGVNP